jgi:hypothetical protein
LKTTKPFITDDDKTVNVYVEDESGFEFICECGEESSEGALENANKIRALLQKDYDKTTI